MSEEKEDSAWTYSITKNKIFLNGQETSLTTDDVSWAEDVQASGITPFGGITLDTVWKKNQTLTDTMRQLIEKIIARFPSLSVSPSDNTILTDIKQEYNETFRFSFDEGKYAYDNTTGCKLTSLSMTYKSDTQTIELFNDASVTEYDITLLVSHVEGSTDEPLNVDGCQLIVNYSYSEGNAPTISGAGETFIEDSTIQAGSGEIVYTIHAVDSIKYGFTSGGILDNELYKYETIYENMNSWLNYETNNIATIKNSVGDHIFAIFIPESINVVPKLYYHMNYSSESTGIDYSDLFVTDTYSYPAVATDNSLCVGYKVYIIKMVEPFKDINEFTIVLEEVD